MGSHNLFVSYDLNKSGQDYDSVINAIKSLGAWAKVQKSLWYVKSQLEASKAAELVYRSMDQNDSLIVVDATDSNACWYNISKEASEHIRKHWSA